MCGPVKGVSPASRGGSLAAAAPERGRSLGESGVMAAAGHGSESESQPATPPRKTCKINVYFLGTPPPLPPPSQPTGPYNVLTLQAQVDKTVMLITDE